MKLNETHADRTAHAAEAKDAVVASRSSSGWTMPPAGWLMAGGECILSREDSRRIARVWADDIDDRIVEAMLYAWEHGIDPKKVDPFDARFSVFARISRQASRRVRATSNQTAQRLQATRESVARVGDGEGDDLGSGSRCLPTLRVAGDGPASPEVPEQGR